MTMTRVHAQQPLKEQVFHYLENHPGEPFEHYDKKLEQAFPSVPLKSLGWYLWMLQKEGKIEKNRRGRRVYFVYQPGSVIKAAPDPGTAGKRIFTVLLERDEDGYFVASCPILPGCHTQGRTREDALANIREAARGYIASMQRHGEKVPQEDLAQVEVTL